MAGIAIHRMRLHDETLRTLHHLEALQTIDRAITSSLDLKVTIQTLLEQIDVELGVDAADLLLFDEQNLSLFCFAGRGFYSRAYEKFTVPLGTGLSGRSAQERRIIRVSNVLDSPEFHQPELFSGEAFVDYVAVPLLAKGEVKGVLEIFQRSELEDENDWWDFLDTLARQAAIAIDNYQLFDGLQRSNLDLRLAYDTTIEGWSQALDLRDKETEGHTQRVAEITLRMGRIVGMSEADLVHVRRGALLHDIGKMGIPNSILLKPGKLSEEEWKVMRQHPTLAYHLLYPIAYLRPALDIPYYHHEKWDGSGYPLGLKKEQIPLAARLFAVVDVWDALSSDRPYRTAWTEEKVLDYIQSQSGKHFDPKIVELFLNILTEQGQ